MKLNPQQAPLYGDCVVTVLLAEEDKVEDDVVFYLVFSGSTLHHYTSTRKVNPDTLETIAPGHDCCETVKVLLCASKEGLPVFVVAEEDFRFIQDEVYDAAQFLATSAGNQQALNFTRFLDRSGPPSGDVNTLDEKVALAFRHLKLPEEWNVLGTDPTLNDGGPRETLMHFAVRLGLLRLTWFLLQKPGGRGALSIHNSEGETPASLALERGYQKLHRLLTEENAGEPDSWSSLSYEIPYGDCSVRHHRELDIYTLTSESDEESLHPRDSRTGHIFKLRNIQQQLMKTNFRQTEDRIPLMITSQNPPPTHSVLDVDDQQHSSPLGLGGRDNPDHKGDPVSLDEKSDDLSNLTSKGKTDCSCRRKDKCVERKEEEVEPAQFVVSEIVSEKDRCLQSTPASVNNTEDLTSFGNTNEETGMTSPGTVLDHEHMSSGDGATGEVHISEWSQDENAPGADGVTNSEAECTTPEATEKVECDLRIPEATLQKSLCEMQESKTDRLNESSSVSRAGTLDVERNSGPVEEPSVPNGIDSPSSLDSNEHLQPSSTIGKGETITKETVPGTETSSRSSKENSDPVAENQGVGDQHSLIISSLAKYATGQEEVLEELEMDSSLTSMCKTGSPSDSTLTSPEKEPVLNQTSKGSSAQDQDQEIESTICCTTEEDEFSFDFVRQQNSVTPLGDMETESKDGKPIHSKDVKGNSSNSPAEVQMKESCLSEGVSDPEGDNQGSEVPRSIAILNEGNLTQDLKLDTPSPPRHKSVSPPHPALLEAKESFILNQAMASENNFTQPDRPSIESVTEDDAISFVPSRQEKGTATPETKAEEYLCGPALELCVPNKLPTEDSSVSLPSFLPAPDSQLSMGNSISVEGDSGVEGLSDKTVDVLESDSSAPSERTSVLPADSALSSMDEEPVGPESTVVQEQDKENEAAACSVTTDDPLCSISLPKEETPPPGEETSELGDQPVLDSCAEGRILKHNNNSVGTPSAILNAEPEQNKEVAAKVSLRAEQSIVVQCQVPLEAGLSADRQGTFGSGECSLPLPAVTNKTKADPEQDRSEACDREKSVAAKSEVKETQSKRDFSSCEESRNVTVDSREEATQDPSVLGTKEIPRGHQDVLVQKNMADQENDIILGLPGAPPEGEILEKQTVITEVLPTGKEKGEANETVPIVRHLKEVEVDSVVPRVLLQPIAEELLPCENDVTGDMVPLAGEGDTTPCVGKTKETLPDGDGAEQKTSFRDVPSQSLPIQADASDSLERENLIEETANHLVDTILEKVRATGGALAVGEGGSPPQCDTTKPNPVAEELEESAAAEGPWVTPEDGPAKGELVVNSKVWTTKKEEREKVPGHSQESEPVAEMPDMKAEDEVDFLDNSRKDSISEEMDVAKHKTKHTVKTQMINRESWCTIEPCPDPSLLASKQNPECENFLEVGLGGKCASSQGVLKRQSGSDSDLFPSPSDEIDDGIIFPKPEEEQSVCDVTGSSSSTDDTASLDRHSSHGSDISLPQIRNLNRTKDRQSLDGSYSHTVGVERQESESEPAGSGEMEEEEMDSITEVPTNCSVLRNSMRSLSPFRRHSWGPGKNAASDAEMNHRSSMRVLGDVVRRPPIHRRSFSLEGLSGGAGDSSKPSSALDASSKELRQSPFSGEERGDSLVSLTEEDLEADQREHSMFDHKPHQRSKQQGFNYCTSAISSPLTKSISLMTISHPGLDKAQEQIQPARRISFSVSISPLLLKSKTVFSLGSSSSDEEEKLHNSRPFHNTSANLTESVTEQAFSFVPQSPSKKDFEEKSGTKVSRTFSYIKNKMSSSKKSREKEKDKDKIKEKDKDSKEKEKDKKTLNGHTFASIPVVGPISCSQCMKAFTNKDAYTCANCGAFVHKGCRESLASCAKVKMKQPKGSLQAHDTSSLPTVIMRNKPSQPKERPRSAILVPDETSVAPLFSSRRSQQCASLSKSVSIQNIAGVGNDESMANTWKFLSHSTDSLNKISKVNESTESLTDEGTDMNEGQLMGDFEMDSKQLEAESWSRIVDSKFLKQQKKDIVKRQEVIYELMQTELHHIRTLKIMSDVYSRGMMTDLLFEQQMVEKLFPCLDELLSIHSQFFQKILERKKESLVEKSEKNFLIKRIGDVLVNQFSGENAERLKKTYGKFCGQHNQSVNYFKDLHTKDKRFQAFVKKKMSSAVVRRLGIPECILLVTQRITKYPVLLQRILQCTKENDLEQEDLAQSLSLVKDVIGAVDSKVANYEKKVRLNEIYTKTDSKSIMRMKSGQMFAKEDLKRKKLVRDGSLFLRSAAGRLKEVQAVLLTDILVFLQEKDQKYVFASLDQKSTVISLKKLIVREVAHEEKGLFLISMGMKDPEMVEVHASSKEERNSWIQIIQDTINTLNRDEDEGIPSENEEEKKLLDAKARELKEQLQQKDQQILTLLEEKEMIFRDMTDCSTPLSEDSSPTHGSRVLFRSNTEEVPKGGPIMKSAINEVEMLQGLVSGSLGGTLGQSISSTSEQEGGIVGPVSLPRRAETFGGFDSHQMNASKGGGEKEDGDDGQDLRRTESDSGLKKGGNANVVFVLKRNSEQVIQSIVHLHELLSTLQGVVLQQDSYIEDQKLMLSERAITRSSSRPNSLIEQEKQRSLEKQRQDLASLQKQQAQHLEEKRRREKEWEAREKELMERETRLTQWEEKVQRGQQDLDKDREELQQKKAAYQSDLERLRAAQKQLEKEQEQVKREMERLTQRQAEHDANQVSHQHSKLMRIPAFFPNPEEPSQLTASSISQSGSLDSELSISPKRNSISRTHKDKGPFHLLSSTSQASKVSEGQSQIPVSTSASTRLFGLAKPKEKKEKKKKSKGGRSQPGDGHSPEAPAEGEEIFC
ncbi:A-kinase anchor protein 13 isoform X3 [Phascolarctos cinereus]|uniref:A-kinase anchor protein 13 n=1 Tax=Phascolarctos cinereus TaxID=38626 RepID=A0A6P5IDW6_PHACI|nr:A-kinase anchor protein 13 isoform X3 [Phascolarctos cinereus]